MIKNKYLQLSKNQNQLGFSLLEVLIAMFLVSLGILGASGLLLKGISNAKTASLRSTAAMQASSLAAAMHINREFWGNRLYEINFETENGDLKKKSGNLDTTKTSCLNCTPEQLAGFSVINWIKGFSNSLPDSTSTVSCPIPQKNLKRLCYIKIGWNERFIGDNKTIDISSVATEGRREFFLYIEL